MAEIMNFIQENYLVIVAVLTVLGYGIKQTTLINDKYIPITLIVLGAILGAVMSLEGDLGMYDGILQGVLCGGAAVGLNQVPKQLIKG